MRGRKGAVLLVDVESSMSVFPCILHTQIIYPAHTSSLLIMLEYLGMFFLGVVVIHMETQEHTKNTRDQAQELPVN